MLSGQKHSLETITKMRATKIGRKRKPFTNETKQKMSISSHKGENHHNWKGDNVQYFSLHDWIRRWKGQPQYCENCGVVGKKTGRNWSIHWANIDHKYRRVLEDYISLCHRCHRKYDSKLIGKEIVSYGH